MRRLCLTCKEVWMETPPDRLKPWIPKGTPLYPVMAQSGQPAARYSGVPRPAQAVDSEGDAAVPGGGLSRLRHDRVPGTVFDHRGADGDGGSRASHRGWRARGADRSSRAPG